MSDLLDRQPPDTPRPRFAPEQGLASLFIGAVMFITAPLAGAVGLLLIGVPTKGKVLVTSLDVIPFYATTLPILLMLFGGFLGAVGIRRAKREGGSVSLPIAGLLLNLTALLLWGSTASMLFIVWFNK